MLTDLFKSLAPAWSVLEAAFPAIALVIAAHLIGLPLVMLARPFGLGPSALPWRYLLGLARVITTLSRRVGEAVAWAALVMVVIQFTIVLMSYVFSVGSIWVSESVLYLHAALFLLAGAYALSEGAHVRVDIFYRGATPRQKQLTDFLGAYLLLLPVMALILWVAYPYVARSWAFFEGSRETSGIQGIYLLKSLILVFGGLMAAEGFASAIRAGYGLIGGSEAGPPVDVEASL